MDVQAYISSGILQEYCLGLLAAEDMLQVEQYAAAYPEIRAEIHAFFKALEQAILPAAVPVPPTLKTKVLDLIDNLAKEKSPGSELPLLNKYSARESWLRIVKPLLPEELAGGIFMKVLRDDDYVFQSIVWSIHNIPDEVHTDTRESFIILEGECECLLGDDIIRLGPGGYLEVPLHVHHSVNVIKGPVLAVLQRLGIA